MKSIRESYTFDDLLLLPKYSEIIPQDVSLQTSLTRNIKINLPIVSSAMDTVTESDMAIAMARNGGIGIIHKNLSIAEQASEVARVKRAENAIIGNPYTLFPDQLIKDAVDKMIELGVSGFPVIDKNGKLLGILTNRDIRYIQDTNRSVSDYMTHTPLITAVVGTTMQKAKEMLIENRKEKLLIVDDNFHLKGLITIKDIQKIQEFPNSCKDNEGRLLVGAAVGTSDADRERMSELIDSNVDVIVVDTAHGHSSRVLAMIKHSKSRYPDIDIIAGNIGTKEAGIALIKAGADAVKVGIGPGSICTTRIVAGVGLPQLSAIMDVAQACEDSDVPIIADGGIKFSGDIAKAIGAGAHSVMLGNLLAGVTESPGNTIHFQGKIYKQYRGMGSVSAMEIGSKERYGQNDTVDPDKLVPEGVEGRVAFKGEVADHLFQLIGGLKSSFGYLGAKNIKQFHNNAEFIKITPAGLRESHPHDVTITREAPNYSLL